MKIQTSVQMSNVSHLNTTREVIDEFFSHEDLVNETELKSKILESVKAFVFKGDFKIGDIQYRFGIEHLSENVWVMYLNYRWEYEE